MVAYRRWVFECDAPRDGFAREMKRALALRGVEIRSARFFDFACLAWGARGYVRVSHDDLGLAVDVKLKSGLFGAPGALEDAVLAAGREAQSRFIAPGGARA